MSGRVLEIWTATEGGAPMQAHDRIIAVAGTGLEGDRYATRAGSYSKPDEGPDRQLTLIAREELEWLRVRHGITMTAGDSRRNILTEGTPLNDLVGARFSIGPVQVEGIRLCQPCKQRAVELGFDFVHLMLNRSGLNCRIVSGGPIAVGDLVAPPPGT
ncbi:MAG: MOSC domain-containing protein [Phycisphaerales bacterium]|jgi:MOSC domain-containing protein YiiM|nr:MOSC domain-containing protein [Phycisphaerales bacterium]